jgi:hypothetical protein
MMPFQSDVQPSLGKAFAGHVLKAHRPEPKSEDDVREGTGLHNGQTE